jgi:hypothetical protein
MTSGAVCTQRLATCSSISPTAALGISRLELWNRMRMLRRSWSRPGTGRSAAASLGAVAALIRAAELSPGGVERGTAARRGGFPKSWITSRPGLRDALDGLQTDPMSS